MAGADIEDGKRQDGRSLSRFLQGLGLMDAAFEFQSRLRSQCAGSPVSFFFSLPPLLLLYLSLFFSYSFFFFFLSSPSRRDRFQAVVDAVSQTDINISNSVLRCLVVWFIVRARPELALANVI